MEDFNGEGNGVNAENDDFINIIVKSPKDKRDIRIAKTSDVKELKVIITKEFSAESEQLCLIYAGKILKDTDRLATYGIKDGTTVHLVIKSLNKTQDGTGIGNPQDSGQSQPPINIEATPFGLGGIGGLLGLDNLGFGSANFMDLQQGMQAQMLSNPNLLSNLLGNPLVKNLMSSPGLLQGLLSANPQMRELIQGNPEISRVLENPELMQQASEVARNPAMLQRLMQSSTGASPFSSTARASQENQQSAEPASAFSSAAGTAVGATGSQKEKDSSSSGGNSQSGGTNTEVTSGGIQSVIQQMMQNPQLMSNIVQAPYMQSTLQNIASNPDIVNQFIGNAPLVPGDAATQETVRAALPFLTQQLANPEVHGLMGNPRALQAMLDVQEGMMELQNEAPGVLGMPRISTEPPSVAPSSGDDQYSLLLRQMFGVMSRANEPTTAAPEFKYEFQLNQLKTMGFSNREANMAVLTEVSGDLNAAVDKLLQQAQQQ